MRYLIFADALAARTRSQAAWAALVPVRLAGTATTELWPVIVHPDDGRAALAIPETRDAAQVGLSQGEYDDLLTAGERASLIDALPADWVPAQ